MLDLEPLDDAPAGRQFDETGLGRVQPEHGDVLGHRQQQRPAAGVRVACPEHGVDLEHGAARIRDVSGERLVHHTLEDRRRHDAHRGSMTAVAGSANSDTGDDPADAATMARAAAALADAADAALGRWVVDAVGRVLDGAGAPRDDRVLARAREAGERARAELMPRLRTLLLDTDVDEQRTTPLALLRSAVRYPTEVLREAGVAPLHRDAFAERNFPDDTYDLTPASFDDLDPSLHDPAIEWGAAKAYTHLARRRREGRR